MNPCFFYFYITLNQIQFQPMKKFSFLVLCLLTGLIVSAQQVPRQMVVLEIGTGTWCQYCPGAALGADDLIANGHNVAVVENHNGDSYANTGSDARNSYYNITGFPTAKFDGTLTYEGGNHTQSLYSTYLPMVNQRNAVLSSFLIDIRGTHTGDTYTITAIVNKVAAYTGTGPLKLQLVLTESELAVSWQGQSELNFVNRVMVPDYEGTSVSFADGNMQIISLTFTKDAAWVANHCELVAFLQDNSTKEILQGNKVALTALQAPMAVNFTANQTNFCGPSSVNFTDQSAGATSWKWEFPGGNPATSTLQNPVVSYATAGTYNVSLTASNATTGNKEVKTNFITVRTIPAAPGKPFGPSGLCINPVDQYYFSSASPTATSYEWEISPSNAGVLTPAGTSCNVNFDDAFIGQAILKVRGVNDCGNSPWSAIQTIDISEQPGQATQPVGPTTVCQGTASSEYTTTSPNPVSGYNWTLSPAAAGTLVTGWASVTVNWDPAFSGTATLTAASYNGSCNGTASAPISVNVTAAPTVYNVTGGGLLCPGSAGVEVGLSNSNNGTIYTLYKDGAATTQTVTGTGSAITFGPQAGLGSYTVQGTIGGTCSSTMSGQATISQGAIPAVPSTPTGPTIVYTGATQTTEYATEIVPMATEYNWAVEPSVAGTFLNTSNNTTIEWNQNYSGTVSVTVKSSNECGTSVASTSISVVVETGVGVNDPESNNMVQFFPNPASNFIYLSQNLTSVSSIKLYDMQGNLVISLPNLPVDKKIDVNNLSSGIYNVTIISNEKVYTSKVVIKK